MSKSKSFAIIAASVALAYPASAWWLGGMIESGYEHQYEQLGGVPYLKLVSRDYQRGVFGATATSTFELSEHWLKSIAALDHLPSARVTMRSTIKHGPFPGAAGPGAGTADVELVFDEATHKEIAKVLGDKPPVQMRVAFGFDGGGVTTASSPAFEYSETDTASGEARWLSWGGANLVMEFSGNLDRYTLQLDMPHFELREGDAHLQLAGASLTGEQHRAFTDEPLFYVGSMKLALARLSAAGPVEFDGPADDSDEASSDEPLLIEGLEYDITLPLAGDYLDLRSRLGAQVFRIGEQDYGPAHYDLSLTRIHARSAVRLQHALLESFGDPEIQAAATIDPSALFAPLTEPALSLLVHNPELSLDRISFTSAHGDALLAAKAKFDDLQQEDIGNPFALIFKLVASGEFSLPLGLIDDLQQSVAGSGEQAQMNSMMFNRQLDAMVEQGYLKREGERISSKIAYKGGELKVNDLPFNPLAPGGAR